MEVALLCTKKTREFCLSGSEFTVRLRRMEGGLSPGEEYLTGKLSVKKAYSLSACPSIVRFLLKPVARAATGSMEANVGLLVGVMLIDTTGRVL